MLIDLSAEELATVHDSLQERSKKLSQHITNYALLDDVSHKLTEGERHMVQKMRTQAKAIDAALAALARPQGQWTPQPDWSQAPTWAQWWAVDEDMRAWWYRDKPLMGIASWVDSWQYDRHLNWLGIDWRTTLRQRSAAQEGDEA